MMAENSARTRTGLAGLSVSYSHAHYKTTQRSRKSVFDFAQTQRRSAPTPSVFVLKSFTLFGDNLAFSLGLSGLRSRSAVVMKVQSFKGLSPGITKSQPRAAKHLSGSVCKTPALAAGTSSALWGLTPLDRGTLTGFWTGHPSQINGGQ